jgi:rare lipoprotein A
MRTRDRVYLILARPAVILLLVALASCARTTAVRPPLIEARPGATQEGVASWYGPGFHGNATTSGEVYDQHQMTAAHQSLPLGTRVAVTNLDNGSAVEVRINDRGPFAKSRVIDLSYAAASALGMIGPGTARVRVQVLGAPEVDFAPLSYTVQAGAFADANNAAELQRRLLQHFESVYVTKEEVGGGAFYRVRIGRFADRAEAVALARGVASMGLTPVVMEAGNLR